MCSAQADWHEIAARLQPDGRAFIAGKREELKAKYDVISPRDGRKIADASRADGQDIDRAVSVARQAFEDGRWRHKAPRVRKDILIKLAGLMIKHGDELAVLESLDMGKPATYARKVDVNSASHCVRWFGEAIDKVYGEIAPTSGTALALIQREPMGVVGAIVPWNYPLLMACWKIAPALACGNSVILKPSEKSPLTALRLAELALEAGVPEGVFNVLPGFGPEAGEPLALHDDVDCIAFTGSTRVGKRIAECAAKSNLKRAWTELGGKSPFIIFPDADLEAAVAACVGSIFFNQGESCNAPSRLYVHASQAKELVERAAQLAPQYAPTDPLQRDAVMGALVDETQMNTVLRYIESGKKEGARLVCGGERVRRESGGYFVAPTIFSGVEGHMCIAREEIFGPVLSVLSFRDEAEAVALANHTPYGLAASVWSRDIDRAHRVARALRAGTVHVNCYDEDDITVPFGGYKQSGNGRDKSLHALDKYTELKTTWIKLNP